MTRDEIEEKLIAVLKELLALSGDPDTAITPRTRPLKDVSGFDSLRAVEAIACLEIKTGLKIKGDVALFVSGRANEPCDVGHIAERVFSQLKSKDKNK